MIYAVMLYIIVGVLFAIGFFFKGYKAIDPGATNTPLMVRLMWVPAAFILWPLILKLWLSNAPSTQANSAGEN